MKKLQNNFTTPEQSKRLLELGLPANSADCYNVFTFIGKIPDGKTYKNVWQMSVWRKKDGSHIEMYPCWSVGRLMEIYTICYDPDYIEFDTFADGTSFLKQILDRFENCIDSMDFSKLVFIDSVHDDIKDKLNNYE